MFGIRNVTGWIESAGNNPTFYPSIKALKGRLTFDLWCTKKPFDFDVTHDLQLCRKCLDNNHLVPHPRESNLNSIEIDGVLAAFIIIQTKSYLVMLVIMK